MATYELTTGTDTIVGTSGNDNVYATAATLNAGDRLTGGGGTDTLALYNSGTFRLDQLATFTGFTNVTLNNDTSGTSELYLGNQAVSVTELGSGRHTVHLGSGATTIHGTHVTGIYSNEWVYSDSSAAWNAGNTIDSVDSLYLNWNNYPNGSTYDFTTSTLTNIGTVYGDGNGTTIKVNSAAVAGISRFDISGSSNNSQLVTADATLDLSHTTVGSFTVTSTNASGTTFTVKDLGTAMQIAGGAGQDTIVALGFNFTAAQRDAIFHTASIETIVDASGTYVAPVDNAYKLTTGTDTIVGTSGNDNVYATAATLNAGDRLTGGGGTDTLALYNSGTFRLDQLATFTGFTNVTLNNDTSGTSELYLGNQAVSVTELGSGRHTVHLGSGATTIHGTHVTGIYSNEWVYSDSSAAWNAGNTIDSVDSLYLNWNNYPNGSTYDFTTSTLTNIGTVYGDGNGTTIKVNSAAVAGISRFDISGSSNNSQLVTADATLDLSHTTVGSFTVTSTNASGTTFTVKDLGTAMQIAGGAGQDTIVALGFNFTAAQRDAIFHTASIETIVDASGTYVAPVDNAYKLTTGTDTIVGTSGNDNVYATAATLNAGDRLTGGGGTDTLALYNSGTFRLDQLATFTGFTNVTLNNDTSGTSELYLGNQAVSVTELGSGRHTVHLGSGATTIHGTHVTGIYSNEWVYSDSSAAWNAGNTIDSVDSLYLNWNNYPNGSTYDFTTSTLTNIGTVYGDGNGTTIKVNSAAVAGISRFDISGSSNNSQLVTADATLDLSHTTVGSFTVTSTNASGTTFTVKDLGTAMQIAGGAGQDTIVALGFNFTAAQRDAIFHTASIETIVDASGTYVASAPLVITETLANDTGLSSTDGFTSVPTLTGTGASNAVVHFAVDGNAIAATATADASGAWTFTPTGLANGIHTVVAGETDAAGNSASTSITFTLDTTAPAITGRLANDTGSSSTDRITSDPTLTGTGEAKAVVHFTVDGSAIATTATADASGAWTFTPTALGNGTHTVVASETDTAGNTGSASLSFTLDDVSERAPEVTAPNVLSAKGQTQFAASALFSVTDPNGDSITAYQFWDSTADPGSGHFTVNGVTQTPVHTIDVTPAQLAHTTFDLGNAQDSLWVRASDGTLWSDWVNFTATPFSNHAPVVAAADSTYVAHGANPLASSLFSVSDADGDTVTKYQFWDSTADPSSGHWMVNGVAQGAGMAIDVTAAQLAQTTFQSGSGTDDLWVRANDGTDWSAWQEFHVAAPVNHAPVVTATDPTYVPHGANPLASSLFSVSDADGDTVTKYQFWDSTADPSSGHWMVNGVAQGAGMAIDVTAAQLAQTTFQSGSGTDDLWVRANDGTDWGAWQEFHVAAPANHAPVVTATDPTYVPHGANPLASSLFSVSDAAGDTITKYQFWDATADPSSGHWAVNGVAQGAGMAIDITAAQLAQTTFQSGSGTDDLWVRANDGTDWGAWQEFHVTAPVDAKPVVTGGDVSLALNDTVGAATLFKVTDGDDAQMVAYQFWDSTLGANTAHFAINGVDQAAGQSINVLAQNIASVNLVAGSTVGTDQLWVRANDGMQWSDWQPFMAASHA